MDKDLKGRPRKPVVTSVRLVPMEIHYDVFKSVEEKLKEFLASLDHQYYIAGMRVAYDDRDSPNEPYVLPYSVEFGYLDHVDDLRDFFRCKPMSEADFLEGAKYSTIPLGLLEEFYEQARKSLQAGANGKELKVGVHIVLTGSEDEGFGIECPCSRQRLMKWVWNKRKRKYVWSCRGHC